MYKDALQIFWLSKVQVLPLSHFPLYVLPLSFWQPKNAGDGPLQFDCRANWIPNFTNFNYSFGYFFEGKLQFITPQNYVVYWHRTQSHLQSFSISFFLRLSPLSYSTFLSKLQTITLIMIWVLLLNLHLKQKKTESW